MILKRTEFQKRRKRLSKKTKKNPRKKKFIEKILLLMNIVIKVSFWRMKTPNLAFLMIREIDGFLTYLIHPLISKGKIVGILQ